MVETGEKFNFKNLEDLMSQCAENKDGLNALKYSMML